MLANWNGEYPSFLCDHENAQKAKLVKYSEGINGLLHWLCDNCFRGGAYYAQRVTSLIDLSTKDRKVEHVD